jgi:hypothetical protein
MRVPLSWLRDYVDFESSDQWRRGASPWTSESECRFIAEGAGS